jgi:hypothetical protein
MHQKQDDSDTTITNSSIGIGAISSPGNSLQWTTSSGNQTLTGAISSHGINFNFLKQEPKTSVEYVVVLRDNTTLVLQEQQVISPREMIGIAKFVNIVTGYCLASVVGQVVEISWSDLISSLKIDKHFVPGPSKSTYDTTGEVLHIFLDDK